MNFKDAAWVRDLIWYEGPLLSVMEHKDKTYFVKWADVNDERTVHTWLIFEVEPEIMDLYLAKALTLRDLEERSPAVFVLEGYVEDADASWTEFENVPENWKARSSSYFDESLTYEAMTAQ